LARFLPPFLSHLVHFFFRKRYNMGDCIFCRIIAGQAPADILFRDDQVTVFRDIHPAAPLHLLIVPNRHIPSLNELQEQDAALMAHLLLAAKRMAAEQGVDKHGYRLIINTGIQGGQTIFHLHMHLLAGRPMRPVG